MDTPDEERELFDHVTCNISASVEEVTVPGALALDLIEQVSTAYYVCIFEKFKIDGIFFGRFIEFSFSRLRWKWRGLISSKLAG